MFHNRPRPWLVPTNLAEDAVLHWNSNAGKLITSDMSSGLSIVQKTNSSICDPVLSNAAGDKHSAVDVERMGMGAPDLGLVPRLAQLFRGNGSVGQSLLQPRRRILWIKPAWEKVDPILEVG